MNRLPLALTGITRSGRDEKALIFAADISGLFEDVDGPLYGFVGGYYGKLLLRDDGSYTRPPSATE